MKSLKWMLAIASAAIMVGCGGGGADAGTSPFGSGSCPGGAASSATGTCTTAATSIDVIASTVQVGSGGDTVTVSAVVKGTGNVGLPGVPVVFSTTSGTLTQPSVVTDASGVATVTFAAGADRSNRTATVTVTSGSSSGKIDVQIVGTTLSYSGVTTVPIAGKVTVSVKASDSKGAVVANLPITVASSLGNVLSATTVITDSQGTASVDYTATNAGADSLSFTGAGITITTTIQISSSQFTFIAPAANASIVVGTPQAVTVQYLVSGAAQTNKVVNFSTTAGEFSPGSATATAVTDGSGRATVTVTSLTASPAVVQATVAGGAAQATLPVLFVAQAPARLVLQVSPTAIGANSGGSTTQQAQLRASVTDANGNPVSNTIVSFSRSQDPSGGTLSQASAVTDSGGQATVQYIAGELATANNGVILSATVLTNPSVVGQAQLTVSQSALFIALGTGNTITNIDPQTYQKDYVVYVTDASGVAVANKDVTIQVLPVEYRKGILVFQNSAWTYDLPSLHTCANEDKNYNGIIDSGDDFNNDGKLEPGNVISVTTASGNGIARTDATGRATISLIYAESYVPWVKVRLVAQATVSGTESTTDSIFYVVGLAADFNSVTNPPAGVVSPFGVNDCATPN
jgi:hypothetical protein